MELRILDDRVLVDPDPPPPEGLVTLVTSKRPDISGRVLALGEGPKSRTGRRLPHTVEVGDHILFPATVGQEVVIGNQHLIVLQEDQIFAVLEDTNG